MELDLGRRPFLSRTASSTDLPDSCRWSCCTGRAREILTPCMAPPLPSSSSPSSDCLRAFGSFFKVLSSSASSIDCFLDSFFFLRFVSCSIPSSSSRTNDDFIATSFSAEVVRDALEREVPASSTLSADSDRLRFLFFFSLPALSSPTCSDPGASLGAAASSFSSSALGFCLDFLDRAGVSLANMSSMDSSVLERGLRPPKVEVEAARRSRSSSVRSIFFSSPSSSLPAS